MAVNAEGSSHQNQNIPRVCSPSDAADSVVNRRELNHHDDTLSDSELYEVPVLIDEIECQLGRPLVPAPSVELHENGANAQVAQEHTPVRETNKAERGRLLRTAKLISVTSIVFDRIKVRENSLKHKLIPREVPAPSATEEVAQENGEQSASVDLLKGWKMELRQRARGNAKDKFYRHPSCTKLYRSLAAVTRLVDETLKSADTTQPVDRTLEELSADTTTHTVDQPLEELPAGTTHPLDETLQELPCLQAPQNGSLPETSSPSKRKLEADALPGGSRRKRRSFYPVSREVKAFPIREVSAEAARSLLEMSKKDMPREEVEAFFLRANTALLNLFGNKEKDALSVEEGEKKGLSVTQNDSKTEIEEMIEELFDDPQETSPINEGKIDQGEELAPTERDMVDWQAVELDVPVPPSAEQKHQEGDGVSKSLPDPVRSKTDNV